MSSLKQRYVYAMVLSGVGDALGYYGGRFEFNHNGDDIFEEVLKLGGLEQIHVALPDWNVSDDTVMHLATGEALVQCGNTDDKEKIFTTIAQAYKDCLKDMSGRAPGATCIQGAHLLRPHIAKGYRIQFNPRGGGCGAAMRAMCVGLRYPRPEQLDDLIEVSVECGRMTHHHPTGYLGSLAAALFTAYCIQGKPAISWGRSLIDLLPQVLKYVESTGHCVQENRDHWTYFQNSWENYLRSRGLTDGTSTPVFPSPYSFKEHDEFVKSVSFSGWGGSSGHDAPMIAYDAFLQAGSNWNQLCNRSMFHGGDSDSTGVIAACWFGAAYGVQGVPELNYKDVEYRKRLESVGAKLYSLAFPDNAV
ncbi:unnamed protein product [Candidula unifasciata]|uniref:ADP-ribosylhydrolase ARH1 n=1 Tax=Candidula unifasciata TaxID=100452 RepID=A0A8S3Z1T1_9EUPU|nr:unnamed protein product [Candidula unifasciata]